MKRATRSSAAAAVAGALLVIGAAPWTAPDGDLTQDGIVTVNDIQCLVEVAHALAAGVVCTTSADCTGPRALCHRGFAAQRLCLPDCIDSTVSLGPDPLVPCASAAADDPDCLGLTARRNADMNCDGAIDAADYRRVVWLALRKVGIGGLADLDGDRRLDGCDDDSDADGLPDATDCAPLDAGAGDCTDDDPCTRDLCDGLGGCRYEPIGAPVACSTPDFEGVCGVDGVCRQTAAVGELVIVEVMAAPLCAGEPVGEWFEVYNRTAEAVDLAGWFLASSGDAGHRIAASVPVPPLGVALLCRESTPALNGGVTGCDHEYGAVALAAGSDFLALRDPADTEVDRVAWSAGAGFPSAAGAALSLDPGRFEELQNDLPASWCVALSPYGTCGTPDRGTPGVLNDSCGADVCGALVSVGCGAVVNGDTTGIPDTLDSYGCTLRDESGGEQAYVFESPQRTVVTFAVQAAADLDVLVLPEGCDPDACFAHGESAAAFTAVAGQRYVVVVDGRGGARGPFTLRVTCSGAPAEFCDDGVDNDGDGGVDCWDEDCFTSPECDRDCIDVQTATCGQVIEDSTAGQLDAVTYWAGCTNTPLAGGERVYEVIPAENTVLTAAIVDAVADLRVAILNGTCNAYSCADLGDPEAAIEVAAGEPYYVVVDGAAGQEGAFTLALTCGLRELRCADGLDDEGDGLADCEDPDCRGMPECVEVCDDGIDNDVDSAVDCADSDCVEDPACGCVATDTVGCDQVVSGTTVGQLSQVDLYDCVAWSETGPERIYQFVPAVAGRYTARLVGAATPIDVFVMEAACGPSHCLAAHDTSVTFDAVGGTTYFIAVDGFDHAAGAYTLVVDCGDLRERDCDDTVDDDADGATDCNDADCAPDPVCRTLCSDLAIDLPCGASLPGGNAGKDDMASAHACVDDCGGWPEQGGETLYRVRVPVDSQVIVNLVPDSGADLDLFVTDAACAPETPGHCEACGDEGVAFAAVADTDYFVMVDGFSGASDTFTLTALCTGASAETGCADNLDNDGDGPRDCADADCLHHEACAGAVCTPDRVISCGDVVTGTTNGQPNELGDYAGAGFWYAGGEVVYSFIAPADGTATATLLVQDPVADNDVVILAGGCGSNYALEWPFDFTSPTTIERGQRYYVVVDAWNDFGVGDFTLELTCE